jgi:iron complex transport system substrate-binding protein
LVGFPSLDYISSEKTRQRISEGKIKELGKNEDINTEILIDLAPDAVIGFAIDGNNSTFATIEKTGIPVLYNSDWTETSPLGKAEWIKFFGVLFDKEKVADSIFQSIESEYFLAKKIASKAKSTPTVISGAMYKDVWYMPQGDSWGAQFIVDANGNYLWKDEQGTGSLSLSLESVLEKGNEAEVWIGPGQFTTLDEMKNANNAYAQFAAFKSGNVYSYSLKKGKTGGIIYFELAPNRPDLVLKDLIKILHPELFSNHELYFFDKLQ